MWVYLAIFLAYAILVLLLLKGWNRAILPAAVSGQQPFISVIVPVRNEENYIGVLLGDVSNQNYPDDKFEVIIVDDHSEDKTLVKIEEVLRQQPFKNISILKIGGKGKKFAITKGVAVARGEIIVTTDGDCRVNSSWLQGIANLFSKDVHCVFGAVRIEYTQNLWLRMQAIEFASLIGTGAATWALGFPTMCNGANLAYRKRIFEEVGGYAGNNHIASGDDEFLLRKISARYPKGVFFNANRESIVTTHPQYRLASFNTQRIRWAGKWRKHDHAGSALLAVIIFLFHVSVVMLPAWALLGMVSWVAVLVLLVSKAMVEGIFLHAVAQWCGIRWSWRAFFLLQLFYSWYVVLIGLAANFLKVSWKGRPT